MDIGVGLPAHLPGVDGATVVESARRGEALGFASLAVIDRIVYPNFEPSPMASARLPRSRSASGSSPRF